MKRTTIVTVMAAWLIGTMSSTSFAANDFEGVWKVKDTATVRDHPVRWWGSHGHPR
jgi:hypothetical protein